jgi:hypothetical protein
MSDKTRQPSGQALKPHSWRDDIAIHPAAELFPRMDDPELVELGEDIKANGLHHPIAVTPDGQLLDGVSRLTALEVAGLKFRIVLDATGHYLTSLDDDDEETDAAIDAVMEHLGFLGMFVTITSDPYTYAIGANLHRRHLTSEQSAS